MDSPDNHISREGRGSERRAGWWLVSTKTRGGGQRGERGSWWGTPPCRSVEKYGVKERGRHDEDEVCPTTDIIFLWNARHSTVCYNVAMARETLDLPFWLGLGGSWAAHDSYPLIGVADRHKHGGGDQGGEQGGRWETPP